MLIKKLTRSGVPLLLCCALLGAQAQTGPLKVVIIEGDGTFNDIERKKAQAPVVEVRDDYDRPVPDARVVFTLPTSGAGGTFADGRRDAIVTTDARGRATARGLTPNGTEGRFPIRITASVNGRQGSAVIWQSNTLAGGDIARGSGNRKKLLLLGLIGGAVAGTAVALAKRNGSSTPGVPGGPTSLSAGTITIGGPR